MDEVPKKNIVSVNLPCTLFSLFGFLTLETGTDRLSWNNAVEIPLCAVWYRRKAVISHDDLAMQALVWLCMVQFRVIWWSVVRFGISYVNLRQPHTFSTKAKEKTLSCSAVNMVLSVPQCDSMSFPEKSTKCLIFYDLSFFFATSAEGNNNSADNF
jgi:hypothetical protein